MALLAGAKGLFYWSYGAKGLSWVKDPARKAELWQRLVSVLQELKALEPVLLAPDASDVLAHPPSNPAIRLLAKRHRGLRYLVAVNNGPTLVQASFRLTEQASQVDVLNEARRIDTSSGTLFSDDFGPYATHVYRFPAASP
jgi:hypothetical protein